MKSVILTTVLAVVLPILVTALKENTAIDADDENQVSYSVWLGIGYGRNKKFICGGALIDHDLVLTSAHCVYDPEKRAFKDEPYVVVTEALDVDDTMHSIPVSKIYTLKRPDPTRYDIAVLRLKTSFPIGGNSPIKTISLPEEKTKLYIFKKYKDFIGVRAVFTDFESESDIKTTNPLTKKKDYWGILANNLKYATAEVIKHKDCDKFPDRLCAIGRSQQKSDLCSKIHHNDRGSPLVYNNELIGITSYGTIENCGVAGIAVFARVSYFIDFIKGIIDNKPTKDTLVASINGYKHFEFFMYKWDITTKSSNLIRKLEKLQRLYTIYNSESEKVYSSFENGKKPSVSEYQAIGQYESELLAFKNEAEKMLATEKNVFFKLY
ncbi:kallikrein 1-related peptidase-like b4 [Copidosoma floridanum]|uniref:kallikrein 1-related peptidase-like b4 n=1 Tax=Copidosoma floridanum TaxID=29053 RepID=UPI000C6F51B2|nr:kallikrein 1-related peptidase-like b4 [Copidosoma floridanum]